LCERLHAAGDDVICLDDLSTGSRDNVTHLEGHARFTLVEHDVTEAYDFDVDRIFNLACPASPVKYQSDPVKTIKTSFMGMLHALELATARGIPVLQASTSEVYGDPTVHPQPESYWGNVNPVGIRACYDEGKRAAETLCFDFWRQFGTRIRVVRIFNTYGPRMLLDDGRVVTAFLAQALRGESLTVFGDGKQTRAFCYIDDLVEGLIRMISQDEHPGPVNLGNPAEFTIIELARQVVDLARSSSEIVFEALPPDDPTRRRPDISQARDLLGWEPTVSLREGLQRTMGWVRKAL
jgi:UDP-glucuronate decarboxylase